jgi:hypothetical protein
LIDCRIDFLDTVGTNEIFDTGINVRLLSLTDRSVGDGDEAKTCKRRGEMQRNTPGHIPAPNKRDANRFPIGGSLCKKGISYNHCLRTRGLSRVIEHAIQQTPSSSK